MAKWTYNSDKGHLCCDGAEWFELAELVYGPDGAVALLLADANRGAESAAYDKAITAATEQAYRRLQKPPAGRGEQVPPQPLEQAIEEAHGGLTAEPAEE